MSAFFAKVLSRRAPSASRGLPEPSADLEAQEATVALRLWQLVSAQLPAPLTDAERRRAGGLLFVGAPQLAVGVADALQDRPELFPDAAPRAAVLRRRQRRALFWQGLHRQLVRMARLCADSYLSEQGAAVRLALQVIEEARHDARDPALPEADRRPGGRIAQKQHALSAALSVLSRREQGKRQARRRARRALGKALAPAHPL